MKQIEEAFSELKKNVEAHLKQPGQERGHVHIVLFADVLREIIRSLVITPNAEPSDVGAAEYNAGSANSLRRNFTQENLEVCLAEGCVMWIDITTPADDRVYCDDASTFSASRLVLDTAEAIRYPETEHIQGKVVITVAQ